MRILVLLVLCLTASWARAEQRVALVIGNSAYTAVPALPNPAKDARAMADQLGRLGFEVTSVIDGDKKAMDAALRAFGRQAAGSDVAMVFYAGHGVQVDGRNYLVPVDAHPPQQAQDLRYDFVDVAAVMDELAGARRLRIVVLDACRDNPIASQLSRSLGRSLGSTRGLAAPADMDNTLIAYATAADTTAADGDGAHSPFTSALLSHIGDPGLDIRLMFGHVRDEVRRATGNRQSPFVYESLGGDSFAFNEGVGSAGAAPAGGPSGSNRAAPTSSHPVSDIGAPRRTAAPVDERACSRVASSAAPSAVGAGLRRAARRKMAACRWQSLRRRVVRNGDRVGRRLAVRMAVAGWARQRGDGADHRHRGECADDGRRQRRRHAAARGGQPQSLHDRGRQMAVAKPHDRGAGEARAVLTRRVAFAAAALVVPRDRERIVVARRTLVFGAIRVRCSVGRTGTRADKHEGDGATPSGVFPLREVLYRSDRGPKPVTELPVSRIDAADGWSDEPADPSYNQRVTTPRGFHCEALWRQDALYDVLAVIGANDDPAVPGRGSAIFLHVARRDYGGTDGCVAIARADLLRVLERCGPQTEIEIR